MSFVISSSQRLASEEKNINFQKITFDIEGIDTEHFNVGFGQPLYTIASDIVCFTCRAEEGVIPVIPCCGISLVFTRRRETYNTYVCGPNQELKKIQVKKGDRVLLFRFIPGEASSLISGPPGEITESSMAAEGNINWGKQITACFCREIETDEKVRNISSILRTYLLQEKSNQIVKFCIDRIYESNGNIKVEKLADETQVTPRYIGKLFEEHVGVSPKSLAGMVKTNSTIVKLMENPGQRLTDIAVECGYFDHTHMNKAFVRTYHTSSGEIRRHAFGGIDYSRVTDYVKM